MNILKNKNKNNNNMIIGVQIIDKNGSNTIYSNEKGIIYHNRKYVKKGFKIKNKTEIAISVEYIENEVIVNFSFFKRGKLLKNDNKMINIGNINGFKYGISMEIFVAQNGEYGTYTISKKV